MAQDTAGKYSLTVGLLFFKNLIRIELHILVGVPVSPKDLGTRMYASQGSQLA